MIKIITKVKATNILALIERLIKGGDEMTEVVFDEMIEVFAIVPGISEDIGASICDCAVVFAPSLVKVVEIDGVGAAADDDSVTVFAVFSSSEPSCNSIDFCVPVSNVLEVFGGGDIVLDDDNDDEKIVEEFGGNATDDDDIVSK